MKKFKLLPIALALLMLSPAAFADAKNSATSNLSITVPPFINITEDAGAVKTSSATFDDTYENITLTPAMNVAYTVITNHNGEKVRLRASGLVDGGTSNACLCGTEDALQLVFTNNTHKPDSSAVLNINGVDSKGAASTTAVASNANAIAFSLTPTLTPNAASGATASTPSLTDNNLDYVLKNGKYGLSLTVGTSAIPATFSTHDEDGTYVATLTLEQVVQP